MKPYLIREPITNEIYEALIVFYRSFGRLVPIDIYDQEKLLVNLIKAKIAKFLIAEKDKKITAIAAGTHVGIDLGPLPISLSGHVQIQYFWRVLCLPLP